MKRAVEQSTCQGEPVSVCKGRSGKASRKRTLSWTKEPEYRRSEGRRQALSVRIRGQSAAEEGIVSTHTLRLVGAWSVRRTARRPVWVGRVSRRAPEWAPSLRPLGEGMAYIEKSSAGF